MRHSRNWLLGLAVLLGLTGAAAGDPQAGTPTVDNPQYEMWSGWRVGTSVTVRTELVAKGGVQQTTKVTHTLKKVSPELAVVEVTAVGESGGVATPVPPYSMDIPAKLPKPDVTPKGTKPKSKQTSGRETLTVAGKKLSCEWFEIVLDGGTTMKTWMCNDVPGQLVKSVMSHPGGSSTSLLLDWKGTRK